MSRAVPVIALCVLGCHGATEPVKRESAPVPPTVEPVSSPERARASTPTTKAPELVWQQLSARQGDQLHFTMHFQDRDSLWRCEGTRCAVVGGKGSGTRQRRTPCDAVRYPTQFSRPSKSGRWLVQTCAEGTFLVDLERDALQRLDLDGAEQPHDGVVDDAGTVTLATIAPELVRVPLGGAARRVPVTPPANAVGGGRAGLVAAHGPWLGFSDGAFADEVGWPARGSPTPVSLGGGAFFNGECVWVSLMTNRYVRLRRDGAQDPVRGGFGGGLPGKGILMSIVPWGDTGLTVAYEEAIVLLDAQLEHVRQIDLPEMDGKLDVGANPQATQLHVASPYDALYVMSLPAEVVDRVMDGR